MNAVVDPLGHLSISSAPDMLPEGWEERRTASGRPYYVNHCTKTTQWEKPDRPASEYQPPPGEDGNRQSSSSSNRSGSSGNRRRPHVDIPKPEGLPEGYEVKTTDQGQIYFLHVPSGRFSLECMAWKSR